jgi:hypothetical protein
MCVDRLNWEASDGKKRLVLPSSTPDLEKSHYFALFWRIFILTPSIKRGALTPNNKLRKLCPH